MAGRIRTHDWGATPLGAIGGWPPSLATMVGLILSAPQPMWIGWGPGLIQVYNDAYVALLDERHPAILGRTASGGWADLWAGLGPDLDAILGGGGAVTYADRPMLGKAAHRVRDLWISYTCLPIPDAGAPNGVGGILCMGVETGPVARMAELQHRMRNVLAVARAVIRRTAETSETVEDFAAHLDGRLGAMARTVTLLSRSERAGVDLELMIREELLAQVADDTRISVQGPDVLLPPKVAEILTLVVHELATNATKHGALETVGGRATIRWRTTEEDGVPWLRLDWIETGTPVAAPAPRRRGFGSELIEQRIAYELKGRGSLDFTPGGLHATVELPLSDAERRDRHPAPER